MFDISDKIVCINDKGLKEHSFLFTSLPKFGNVYVVRDMDYHPETMKPDGIPGVLLVGIFGGDWYKTGTEFCFAADRFVPLDEYRKNREEYIRHHGGNAKELPKVKKIKVPQELEVVHC